MRIATWNVNSLKARLEKVTLVARARPPGRPAHAGDQARRRGGAGRRLPRRRATSSPTTARAAGTAWPSPAAAASRTWSPTSASRCGPRGRPDVGDDEPLAEARMIVGGLRRHPRRVASTRRTAAWWARPSTRPSSPGSTAWPAGWPRPRTPRTPLVLGGDFNVAPEDADVWDPRACHGGTHVSPPEREAFARLLRWGLVDAYRLHHPEPGRYTWWDYRAGNFHKNFGMRIDHLLVSAPLRARTVAAEIDREARKGKPMPSDHAPLVIDVDAPGCPFDAGWASAEQRIAARLARPGWPRWRKRRPASRSSRPSSRCSPSSPTDLPEGDGWLFEPKWDGFRAIVFRDGDRGLHPEPRLPAARPLLPGAAGPSSGEPARARGGGRRDRDRGPRGLDFDALQLRLHPAASRVAKLAAETPASFVAFDLLAEGDRRTCAPRPQAERRERLEQALAGRLRLRPPHALHAPAGAGPGVVPPLRGRGPRRRDRQARGRDLPAGQARDGQGQAHAHRRLRGGRLPLAQARARRAGGIAAARALRREGHAPPRRRDVVVHDGRAPAARRRSWSRCARTRWRSIPGASGPRRWTARSGCRAARAAGARARTSPGSRCASSACAR